MFKRNQQTTDADRLMATMLFNGTTTYSTVTDQKPVSDREIAEAQFMIGDVPVQLINQLRSLKPKRA